jgi:Family of unknown function (DUF5343)
MPAELPYMASTKNLADILNKIESAGTPPRFTNEFLKTLGFTSSNDRTIIKVLKGLGFLASDGTPTERYNEFRNPARSGAALAQGLREGWPEVFLADQQAHARSSSDLVGLFKNVTGKGDAVAQKMATTFKALADRADFAAAPAALTGEEVVEAPAPPETRPDRLGVRLHHDVHLHLPPTSDVAVYTAIFRALRAELLD